MTEELAVLLRKAAEKWPEKFEVVGSKGLIFVVKTIGVDYDLAQLDNPHLFPCDAMDAISGAVGMFFTVEYGHVEDLWRYRAYIDKMHCRRSDWRYADKRRASIAALCAVLKYKLENP